LFRRGLYFRWRWKFASRAGMAVPGTPWMIIYLKRLVAGVVQHVLDIQRERGDSSSGDFVPAQQQAGQGGNFFRAEGFVPGGHQRAGTAIGDDGG